MLILKFIPDAVFYLTFFAGLIAFLLVSTSRKIPNQQLFKTSAGIIIAASIFFMGAVQDNNAWLARVKELEQKVQQAEVQSKQINTEVIEKVVYKTQVLKERGRETTKFIDREVVKYDTTCVIPEAFVASHNRSAEVPR